METPLRRIVALLLVLFVCFSFVACFETLPDTPSDDNPPAGPSDPTDPSNPTDPSEPTDPNEPTDPSEPTDPNEPTVPSDPTDPSEPDDPLTKYNTPISHYYTVYFDPILTLVSSVVKIERNIDGNVLSVTEQTVPMAIIENDEDGSSSTFRTSFLDFSSMLLETGIFYRYDANGKLVSIEYTAAAAHAIYLLPIAISLPVSYDEKGHPSSAISQNGNIYGRFTCDENGRIVREVWENPAMACMLEYDENGYLSSLSAVAESDDFMKITYSFTSENVFTAVGTDSSGDGARYSFTMDDRMNLTKIDMYHTGDDDGDGFSEEMHAEYLYNEQGLCTAINNIAFDGSENIGTTTAALTYAPTGSITSILTSYTTDETVTEEADFLYDQTGLQSILIERSGTNAYEASFVRGEDGQIVFTEKTADSQIYGYVGGTVCTETIFSDENDILSLASYTVTLYDENDLALMKQETLVTQDGLQISLYDQDGNVSRREKCVVSTEGSTGRVATYTIFNYGANDTLRYWEETIYTRNAQGRVINAVTTRYNADNDIVGEITKVISYTYNAYGHLTRCIEEYPENHKYVTTASYDANGVLLSREETLYWYENGAWVEDDSAFESEIS